MDNKKEEKKSKAFPYYDNPQDCVDHGGHCWNNGASPEGFPRRSCKHCVTVQDLIINHKEEWTNTNG